MTSTAPTKPTSAIGDGILRVTAPNPGPMTAKGTNAYVICGRESCFIVDPGPDDARQLQALEHAVGKRRIEAILVTHRHGDHIGLVPAAARHFSAPILAAPPFSGRAGQDPLDLARPLSEGDALTLAGRRISVVATPGHTADHLAFALDDEGILFSGDHVMGWSTTVVIPPEGRMADYRASLARLLLRNDTQYLPGHGDPVERPQRLVRGMLAHRGQREEAILAILRDAPSTVSSIVERAYPPLDAALRAAAALSVRAHLIEIYERGFLSADPITGEGPFALAS